MNANRRSQGHITAATAMASTDGSNSVPSIFGHYSHDGDATSTPIPVPSHLRTTQASALPSYTYLRAGTGSNSQPAGTRISYRASQNAYSAGEGPHSQSVGSASASPRLGASASYVSPIRFVGINPWNSQSSYQVVPQDSGSMQHHSAAFQPLFEENSLVSFTWTIRDLFLLREEVESTPTVSDGRSVSAGAGKSEVWTTRPIFGDGKWRLELVRTNRPRQPEDVFQPTQSEEQKSEAALDTSQNTTDGDTPKSQDEQDEHDEQGGDRSNPAEITVLSIYLASIVLEYSHSDFEIPASIMVGIRPAREPLGKRGSPDGGWVWRQFYDFTFKRERDFFICNTLPSISQLMNDEAIRRDDAFSLTIQVGRGPAHAASEDSFEPKTFMPPYEAQGSYLVPRSMLDSLQGLLDDSNTGDVRILVRERGVLSPPSEESRSTPVQPQPYPVGSSVCSETGADSWQSNEHVVVRDRILWAHSSVLKSRSEYFKTMLGSNFREGMSEFYADGRRRQVTDSNARQVRTLRISDADFATTYWFLRYLYTEEIKFAENEDVRSAILDDEWTVGGSTTKEVWEWTPVSDLVPDREEAGPPVTFSKPYSATIPRSLSGRTSSGSLNATSPVTEVPPSQTDPHVHPASPPAPASALAIFKLAHRYNMSDLSDLASAHLVASLTPTSAFPVLLATSMYQHLHARVTKYVYNNWEAVSNTPEFERCCDEVSTGEWGSEAGKALRTFMKSLVSPARIVPATTSTSRHA